MGATHSTPLRYKRLNQSEVDLSEFLESESSSAENRSFTLQNLRTCFQGFWTRLHTSTRISIGVSVVLVIMITLVLIFNRNSSKYIYKDRDFAIDENTSEEISSIMNTSVDPCDNFYQFACHGWPQKHTRPEYYPEWTVFDVLSEKRDNTVAELMEATSQEHDIPAYKLAQNFYKSCVQVEEPDEQRDELVLDFVWNTLETYGGWPILYENGTWNSSNFNWIKSMTGLATRFKTTTILDIYSYQDPNTIVVSAPSSDSGRISNVGYRKLATKDINLTFLASSKDLPKGTNAVKDVIIFIIKASKILSKFKGRNNFDEKAVQEQVTAMIKLEGALASASAPATKTIELSTVLGHHEKKKGIMTLEELQRQIDIYLGDECRVEFREILELLYGPAGVGIETSESIAVTDMNYLLVILKHVQQADSQILANLLHYKMLAYMMPMLTKEFRELIENRRENIDGSADSAPRRKICAADTEQGFKFAVGQKIVTRQYQNKSEFNRVSTQIKQMFNQIRNTLRLYRRSLNSYLEDKQLTALIDYTEACIGAPDWLFDPVKVQEQYAGLQLENMTTYLEQTLAANQWASNNQLRKLRQQKDVEACEWNRFRGEFGAFTDKVQYRLYFPLEELQSPLLRQGQSLALNYGSMGTIIGHELTHAFSSLGWEKSKGGSFSHAASCLVNQYSNFSLKDSFPEQHSGVSKASNLFLSGAQTLNENFADNGGIALAYKSFKNEESSGYIQYHGRAPPTVKIGQENYTNDQLFFIGFAQKWCGDSTITGMKLRMSMDVHSPGFFRVMGTLQNSEEFAKAWNCPIGSKMNTGREKCAVL